MAHTEDRGSSKSKYRKGKWRRPLPPTLQPPSIPLSEILLANARLQERIEGKTELMNSIQEGHERERKEWHSERDFLRTDVTEMRSLVRGSLDHSDHMLDTFKHLGTKQAEDPNVVAPQSIVYRLVQNGDNPTGESRPLQ
jgi:hypothetical protein